MSDEPIQDLRKIQPAPPELLPMGDTGTPAHIEAPEKPPKHPRWLRKLRTSAAAGAGATALTAGLELLGPGALSALGISSPLVMAGAVAGVSLLKDGVGYFTRSDPKDFPQSEPISAEEVREMLQRAERTNEAASAIQGEPKLQSTPSTTMASENIDALKSGITAGVELIEVGIRVGSDGFQLADAGVVLTDEELREKSTVFLKKADEIPAEIADLQTGEMLDLTMHGFNEVKRLFA